MSLTQENELWSANLDHDMQEAMASKRFLLDGRTMHWKGYISRDPMKRSDLNVPSK